MNTTADDDDDSDENDKDKMMIKWVHYTVTFTSCLLYTSDAADE